MTAARRPFRKLRFALLLVLADVLVGCDDHAPAPIPILKAEDAGAVRARVSACLGSSLSSAVAIGGPPSIGGMSDDVIACVAAGAACPDVLACLGLAGPPCDGNGRCDGDVAVHCARLPSGLTAEVNEDCAARVDGNRSCAVVDDAGSGIFAACNAGACAGTRCDGDTLVSCFGDVEIDEDCAAEGRVCVRQADQAFCALPETCARDHCEGSTAVLCRAGHADMRQDCATLVSGGRCRDQAGIVDCVADPIDPGCPIDEPYFSGCDGAAGFACHAGARLSVDCPAFQASHCEMDPEIAEARCVAAAGP